MGKGNLEAMRLESFVGVRAGKVLSFRSRALDFYGLDNREPLKCVFVFFFWSEVERFRAV